jgi:hypothetical protein
MARYELTTRYDSRKSFGGKAHVETYPDGSVSLISYTTRVATIPADGKPVVFGTYSNTTLRHIREFLLQHGYRAESKSQIVADYLQGTDTDIGNAARVGRR